MKLRRVSIISYPSCPPLLTQHYPAQLNHITEEKSRANHTIGTWSTVTSPKPHRLIRKEATLLYPPLSQKESGPSLVNVVKKYFAIKLFFFSENHTPISSLGNKLKNKTLLSIFTWHAWCPRQGKIQSMFSINVLVSSTHSTTVSDIKSFKMIS